MEFAKYYQLVYSPEWKELTDDQRAAITTAFKKSSMSKKAFELEQKMTAFVDGVEAAVKTENSDEEILDEAAQKFNQIVEWLSS